jgi:hypothetical protein
MYAGSVFESHSQKCRKSVKKDWNSTISTKKKIGIHFLKVGNYIFVVEKFGICKRWITGR